MAEGLLNLLIDGRPVSVPAGTSLLEAARAAGVRVPTLCLEHRLAPAEACRMCLVEVEGEPRPVASCSFPAREGQVVRTAGPRLQAERRALFELLLADHYGDCVAPCTLRCPAGMDVQGYIALIARGQYQEAVRLMRRDNPLPSVCGYICPHPCETQCRRGLLDQPLAIRHLKRFAADFERGRGRHLPPPALPATGRRLAVIGGGAQGLATAFFMALAGHHPTIFESLPELGGLLRRVIPVSRLPRAALDWDIEGILALGVMARTGIRLGGEIGVGRLLSQGFDALVLATGGWDSALMQGLDPPPETALPGVRLLLPLAMAWSRGGGERVGRRVVVAGRGREMLRAAGRCLALGAEQATVLWEGTRREAGLGPGEEARAEAAGVNLVFGCTLTGLRGRGDRLQEVVFQEGGPHAPAGEPRAIAADALVAAQARLPVLVLVPEAGGGDGRDRAWRTLRPSRAAPGRVAGLFEYSGTASDFPAAVEAIGAGRLAADTLDRWLNGREPRQAPPFRFSKGTPSQVDPSNFAGRARMPRTEMALRDPAQMGPGSGPLELGLGEEAARAEARRCLACGCLAANQCLLREVAGELGLTGLHMNPRPARPWSLRTAPAPILIEDGKCIVCRRCERVCAEYHGREAVTVAVERAGDLGGFRGHRLEISRRCDACGLCVSVCPTGALSYRHPFEQPEAMALGWQESLCLLCPLACRLRVGAAGEHLARVEGVEAPPAFGHLCRRARFELVAARASAERLTAPLLRGRSGLEPADWDRVLGVVAGGLAALRQAQGGGVLAGLATGYASQEELYLFGKLVRLGLASNHLDYLEPGQEHPWGSRLLAGMPAGTGLFSYEELEAMDTVVVVGSELSADLPLLESALHRMGAAGGRLAVLGRDRNLAARAGLHRDLALAPALEMVRDLLAGPVGDPGQWPGPGRRVQILVREAELEPAALPALKDLAREVAALPGVRLGLVPAVPSVMGLRRSGIGPDRYPGHRPMNPRSRAVMERASGRPLPAEPGLSAGEILEAAGEGRIRGLVLLAGHSPAGRHPSQILLDALEAADLSVVISALDGPLVRAAKAALPWPMTLETAGTYRGLDGSRLETQRALSPPQGVPDGLTLLERLLRELGGPAGAADLVGVQSELIVIAQLFAEDGP